MSDSGTARPAASLAALALLEDPQRAALYEFIAAQDREVSREDAATAVGLKQTTAAFHLDKLARAGLLRVTFRRLGERKGRGGGRPTKLYQRAAGEVSASVPPRAYETAARLLAETVEEAGAEHVLAEAARQFGVDTGRKVRAESHPDGAGDARALLWEALRKQGYEPAAEGATVRLRNCPFHNLAVGFRPLVCGMNISMLEGLLEGLREGLDETGTWTARMDPVPGRCCVAIHTYD